MNTPDILSRAAALIERQGTAHVSLCDAVAIAAGSQPGQSLAYEAYTAARDFARWLGFDADDELAVENALSEQWADRPENTEDNIVSALRRASAEFARSEGAHRAARGVTR